MNIERLNFLETNPSQVNEQDVIEMIAEIHRLQNVKDLWKKKSNEYRMSANRMAAKFTQPCGSVVGYTTNDDPVICMEPAVFVETRTGRKLCQKCADARPDLP